MLGKFEEVVLFVALFDFTPFRTKLAIFTALLVGDELLLTDGVVALVALLVDLTAVVEFLKDGLDAGLVAILRSSSNCMRSPTVSSMRRTLLA